MRPDTAIVVAAEDGLAQHRSGHGTYVRLLLACCTGTRPGSGCWRCCPDTTSR